MRRDIAQPLEMALLHKWPDDQGSPSPGQTYPTVSFTGTASAVNLFSAAMWIWNPAT